MHLSSDPLFDTPDHTSRHDHRSESSPRAVDRRVTDSRTMVGLNSRSRHPTQVRVGIENRSTGLVVDQAGRRHPRRSGAITGLVLGVFVVAPGASRLGRLFFLHGQILGLADRSVPSAACHSISPVSAFLDPLAIGPLDPGLGVEVATAPLGDLGLGLGCRFASR